MKNFITKSALFLVIITTFGVALSFLEKERTNSQEFMAVMYDKHDRVQTIKTPKIIFAGGSSLVFGIDSQKIEEELGVPVVNLGLNAELGLRFMLKELKDVVKPGDFIVLTIEHSVQLKGNHDLHALASYYYPNARNYCGEGTSKFKSILENTHMLYKKTVAKGIGKIKKDVVYSRDSFNKYGDGIKHLDLPPKNTLGSKSIIKNNRMAEINALNDFHRFTQENDISIIFSYAPYEQLEYVKNKKELNLMHDSFQQELQIKMITDIETFVYPSDYFFDSVYHLNKNGREIHTSKLIHLLAKEIKMNKE